MIKKDRQVVTFSSPDGIVQIVICMDEMDVTTLDERVATPGTHFINGWSARIFFKTGKGVLVLIPQ